MIMRDSEKHKKGRETEIQWDRERLSDKETKGQRERKTMRLTDREIERKRD
jgi:hypothetical protein